MATKITREIIDSYLNCKYKGHLKLAGEEGTRTDYELLLTDSRDEVRRRATDKILVQHQQAAVERDLIITPAALKRGTAFLLNATMEDEQVSLAFDGLMRVPGASNLGDFHYIPVLFIEGRKVRKQQRALLDVYALLLSRLQGRAPASGLIWHGQECRTARVQLKADPRKTERLLEELRMMQGTKTPPQLILNSHCAICAFRQRCHQQAVQEDNISLLRGIKEKEVRHYAKKGILTVTQLAFTFRPRRKGKKMKHKDRHSHPLQALAIRDKKTYVLGLPQLPSAWTRVYLDLEGKPEEGFVYLIGILVVTGEVETRYSFWADDSEREVDIFERFLEVVQPYDDFCVYCYGSYELAFLRRMTKCSRNMPLATRVLKNTVNILSVIYAHVHFPVTSNGLKEVGRYLGCTWTDPDASGLQSLVWRTQWEKTPDERLKQQLTTYNLEDCVALKRVTEFLLQVLAHAESGNKPTASGSGGVPVPDVQDADQIPFRQGWGTISFVHPDFAHINKCAYFNYQRQRVYIRTSKLLKRIRGGGGKRVNSKLRVSKRIVIEGRSCPQCKSKAIVQIPRNSREIKDPRSKKAFDLVFTPAGVKRRVIECRTIPYRCQKCGTAFLPDRYERLDKHFHALKSWAMYQHVAQDLGLPKIEAMLMELFGLLVRYAEIHMFKALMARRYRAEYEKLSRSYSPGRCCTWTKPR
jgi:predicted RecB family nuclease